MVHLTKEDLKENIRLKLTDCDITKKKKCFTIHCWLGKEKYDLFKFSKKIKWKNHRKGIWDPIDNKSKHGISILPELFSWQI